MLSPSHRDKGARAVGPGPPFFIIGKVKALY